jgi:hypothetical protein
MTNLLKLALAGAIASAGVTMTRPRVSGRVEMEFLSTPPRAGRLNRLGFAGGGLV